MVCGKLSVKIKTNDACKKVFATSTLSAKFQPITSIRCHVISTFEINENKIIIKIIIMLNPNELKNEVLINLIDLNIPVKILFCSNIRLQIHNITIGNRRKNQVDKNFIDN